jgi:hypothetical protein
MIKRKHQHNGDILKDEKGKDYSKNQETINTKIIIDN